MFRGNVRPNRVTWLMWGIAPIIATAAALSKGVGWAVLPVFMSGFSPLLIFIFSFIVKNTYWKLTIFDYACGFFSALALVLWAVTKEPNTAIIFAIASDGVAAIPTLRKGWNHPETESPYPFFAGLFGAATSFLAIQMWTLSSYAFPIYLAVINILLLLSIYRGKRKVLKTI